MTAHAMQGDKERCLAMGFDGYIAKPVSQEALQQEIARVGPESHNPQSDKGLPDEARLLKQCADDPALVQELLDLFGEGLDEAVATIARAIDSDDREALGTGGAPASRRSRHPRLYRTGRAAPAVREPGDNAAPGRA